MKHSSILYLFEGSSLEVNKSKLIDYVTTVTYQSLSKLSSPCASLSFRPHFIQLVKIAGCDETKVKNFPRVFWKDMPELKRKTWMNPVRMFEVALMIYFSENRKTFSLLVLYTLLDIYSSLYRTLFRYCKPDLFELSLTLLSKNHLFAREGGIGPSLSFLSSELAKKYYDSFRNEDKGEISKFISEARTRVAQSLKSLARTYYKASKRYSSTSEESDMRNLPDKFRYAGDLVSYQVNVIARINAKALNLTELMVGRNPDVLPVLKAISVPAYKDNIATSIAIFLESNPTLSTRVFCDNKKFLDLYKKILRVKATTSLSYKSEIQELVSRVSSKPVDSKQVLFVGLYLLNVLRVSLCRNL